MKDFLELYTRTSTVAIYQVSSAGGRISAYAVTTQMKQSNYRIAHSRLRLRPDEYYLLLF